MTKLPTEHLEQVTLLQWYDATYPDNALFAIPNGGKRHPRVALEMKREGVRPGVPDLMLPIPSGGYCGLFIEMKKQKGGRTSSEQKKWLERLSANGYRAVVCAGFEAAKAEIEAYLAAR